MSHTRSFARIAFPLAVFLALSGCSSIPAVAPASSQAPATGLGAKGCADEQEGENPDDESGISLPSSDADLAEALSETTRPDVDPEPDSASTDDEEPMDDEQDYIAESEELAPETEIETEAKGLACSGDTDESLITEAELGDDQSDTSEAAFVTADPVAAAPEPPATRAQIDTPPPPTPVAEVPSVGTSSVLIAGLDAECATQTDDKGTVVACGPVKQLPKSGTAFTQTSVDTTPTASPSVTPSVSTPATPSTPTVSTPTASTSAKPTTEDSKEDKKNDPGKVYCNALPKARTATRAAVLLPRAADPAFPPGLYVQVIDGLIQLTNRGGVQQFAAGQFGFTGSVVTPPVIIPSNPGIQFNPPPAFQSSTGPQSGSSSSSKPNTVDCEVRSAPKRSPRTASVAAADSMARGSIVFVVAGGLRPTSAVSVYLLSAPGSPLGTFDADADGNLSAWVRLPEATTLGADALQVNGFTPTGYTAAVTVGVTVREATTAIATKDITFEPGSAQLTGAAQASLGAMLGTIPVGTSTRCTASSVTRVGTRAPSNTALATARENAAAAYLTALGLECTPGKPRADTTGNPDPERLVTVKVSFDQ